MARKDKHNAKFLGVDTQTPETQGFMEKGIRQLIRYGINLACLLSQNLIELRLWKRVK